jgi:hypothetical protein
LRRRMTLSPETTAIAARMMKTTTDGVMRRPHLASPTAVGEEQRGS